MNIFENVDVDDFVNLALRDSDSSIRALAVKALRLCNDSRVVNLLIDALQDTKPLVRRSAVVALIEIGDRTAIEPLSRVLVDEEYESVRSAANDAIMAITTRENEIFSNNPTMLSEALREMEMYGRDAITLSEAARKYGQDEKGAKKRIPTTASDDGRLPDSQHRE